MKMALNERKLVLDGPILHFHDYGRKSSKGLWETKKNWGIVPSTLAIFGHEFPLKSPNFR